MHYFSTNRQAPITNFDQATVLGQAPDKGLYYPADIPNFDLPWHEMKNLPKNELAFRIIKPYVAGTIPDNELRCLVADTVNFDFPLVQVTEDIYSLELFHGPTLAFKDVGARFMSRCLGYFNKGNQKKVTVLVATSGDTGGAVANGFENVEGIEVIILYPSGKVSPVQELQLTTCGENITALEVKGTFDDCQAIVKQAFLDADLNNAYQLTSANSINVARWLPQQLYYCFALQLWPHDQPPVISVPSGNFGNICAGMVAWASGLPVKHFIAACNVNDVVPRFLQSGNYAPKEATATISNAMDVGNPSNFVRIMELFLQDASKLSTMLSGYTISDETTRHTIARVYKDYGYILDPHGAVGFKALEDYLQKHPGQKGIFLETAHPVKFPEVVEEEIGRKLEIPEGVRPLFHREKQSIILEADYEVFKGWMMGRSRFSPPFF
jgi:threonine synthase